MSYHSEVQKLTAFRLKNEHFKTFAYQSWLIWQHGNLWKSSLFLCWFNTKVKMIVTLIPFYVTHNMSYCTTECCFDIYFMAAWLVLINNQTLKTWVTNHGDSKRVPPCASPFNIRCKLFLLLAAFLYFIVFSLSSA